MLAQALTALCILSLLLVAYTYAGYPLLVHWLAGRKRLKESANALNQQPAGPADRSYPTVTALFVVRNEEARVQQRIENIRRLNYPQHCIEILAVSDGSTDHTAALLQSAPGVRAIIRERQSGKSACINVAVPQATGEFLLMLDVRQTLEPDALQFLVERMRDPHLGAVSGELVFKDPKTNTGQQVGAYWKYEKWIRDNENTIDSTIGVTGAIYLARRSLFPAFTANSLLDDVEVPMLIARQGYRIGFEKRAIVTDTVQEDVTKEAARKLRTLGGNFQLVRNQPWLLNPGANRLWWQFVSHKILRLVVPWLLLIALVTSAVSELLAIRLLFYAQVACWALALLAKFVPVLRTVPPVGLVYMFAEMNWVAMKAGLRFFSGGADSLWTQVR